MGVVGRFLFRMAAKAAKRKVRRRVAAFHAATHKPMETQAELLQYIIAKQRGTGFGKDHGFAEIKTLADFRAKVPVAPYEYVHPYVQRVAKGEITALLADPKVLMFALTSGTTASRKMIPITSDYLADYRRGWNVWGMQAIDAHPVISMRTIAQMVGDPEEFRTEAGMPCGNLSGYTAAVQLKLVQKLYSIPALNGKIKDATTRYYVAMLGSMRKQLGMLMSPNPSTLIAFARVLDSHKESLIRDLRDGTLNPKLDIPDDLKPALMPKIKPDPEKAKRVESVANKVSTLLPKHVWIPEEMLIGCWTGGSVGPYLKQLPQFYGNTFVRDMGLLASEGRMTIPIADNTSAGVLDITSHFFEFIPEAEIDSKRPISLAAHEVKEGESYYIIPTTKSGLYRYNIVDLVRVAGFHNKTPLIEFLGKGNRFANLTGEKLSEHQVTQAMMRVQAVLPQPVTAYALAPVWHETQPHYGIFLEEQDTADKPLLNRFLEMLEVEMRRSNVEYESKRDSGRLGKLQAFTLPTGGWRKWDLENLAKRGGSPEQYKHPCLIGDLEFAKTIGGTMVG